MRILIDGETICDEQGGVGAGIEHYTWEIISALIRQKTPHTFILSVPAVLGSVRLNTLVQEAQSRVIIVRPWLPRLKFFSRHVFTPLRWMISRPDVVFSPFGQIPFGWFGPSVLTIHDVAIYEHPEWFADLANQDFSTRVVVPRSLERAQALLAVSQTTAQRLVQYFPSCAKKTHVVYEGVNPPRLTIDRTSIRFPFDRDILLFLGTVEPRKNIPFALEAFDAFLRQHPECATTVRFIIAGKKGWASESVFQLADDVNRAWSDVEPDGVVHFLGMVTEEEKWTLLSRAAAFVFPSFDEGFGLPVLEAMSVGTPVIASKAEAITEVGGDAVITVDDIESFALAIAQCVLLPEGVALLRQEGIERAKIFTWEKAAKEIRKILETSFSKK